MIYKKLSLVLSLIFATTFLSSCGNFSENENINKTTLEFDFDEKAVQTSYDENQVISAGNPFVFTITINKNYSLNYVKGNGKDLSRKAGGSYILTLVEGKNVIEISTSMYQSFSVENVDRNPRDCYETMWKNRGYPHFPSIGNQKLLVIPVKIKGYEYLATEENINAINTAFFANSQDIDFESVASYYCKSSYGRLNISGQVSDWFDCNLTAEEISSYANDKSYGTYGILDSAIEWIKSTQANIDLKDYDNNRDGFIDGVYLVYGAPTFLDDSKLNSNTFWNFTFYNINNKDKNDTYSPIGMTYSWSSIENIFKGYNTDLVDAHIFIHEFGHQLGLTDYYDTSGQDGTPYTSPMGGLDMMDNNIGDHSSFSKFALGWVEPKKIVGTVGSVDVTIHNTDANGDFLILGGGSFNNSPFNEYFIIEYLSVEKNNNNLNYYDAQNGYKVAMYSDGRIVKFYEKSGIRITHIDARAIDSDGNYSYDLNNYTSTKFTNTPSTKKGYYCEANNNSFVLTSLISRVQTRNTLGTFFVANSSDLFVEGDEINFYQGDSNSRAKMLPYEKNCFDSGEKFDFKIKILSVDSNQSTIRIYN
ncbi:MAG: immune inhibitor A [Candidatus Onthovivens sp.]|nr:immune inhibitor A [Candidatus Onthovivens sp.]